jgi:phenylpyruvate tautomerase PptA (4-oxalocrotonate tautomerase family)
MLPSKVALKFRKYSTMLMINTISASSSGVVFNVICSKLYLVKTRRPEVPVIKYTLIKGYDAETIATLSRRMTDAVRATIAAPPDGITVIAEEVPATNYMRGGKGRTPGAPVPGAVAVVSNYLDAMEARDLTRAQGYLHDDFEMVLPGGVKMQAVEVLMVWSKNRYKNIRKAVEGFDEAFEEDRAIVWCRGTLHGTRLDGSSFEGIRFSDRFELVAGRILRQEVWNDLAEHRPS